jgi:hypothetical protein
MSRDRVAVDIRDQYDERLGQRVPHNAGLALAAYDGDRRWIHLGLRFEIVPAPKRAGGKEQTQKQGDETWHSGC